MNLPPQTIHIDCPACQRTVYEAPPLPGDLTAACTDCRQPGITISLTGGPTDDIPIRVRRAEDQ